MIKIAENNVVQRGQRGHGITLPAIWVKDHNLSPGITLEIYRGEVAGVGKDCLVIKNPVDKLEK